MTKLKSISKEIIVTLIIIFVISNIISYIRSPVPNSSSLPKLNLALIDGKIFNTDIKKPLIIHFWASWCPVCKLEASNIEKISQKYETITIAVNSGDNDTLSKYIKTHKLTFRVFNDKDGSLAKIFNVSAFPTTFIYDSDGKLSFTEVGYTSTAGLFARMLFVK